MVVDIVSAAVGLGVIYVWSRRLRGVHAHWRYRNSAEHFEREFHRARERRADRRYRVATATDDTVRARRHEANRDAEALVAAGFREIGDIVTYYLGEAPTVWMRAFVDAEATTCAIVSVGEDHQGAWPWLASFRGDDRIVTLRGSAVGLARPPSSRFDRKPTTATIDELLRSHRASIHADDGNHWQRIDTRDELIARLHRDDELATAWRDAQPPDDLLDADLRALLDTRYEQHGAAWANRLRAEPPRATVYRA
jgi:hypothetical protein